MSNLALKKFRQQLSDWIDQRINSGSYPFRRVEATDTLRNLTGSDVPGLILWINRDSLLAGGLILLPRQVDETSLDIGRRMAAAIGLQNFVTWGARQVTVWQASGQSCEKIDSLNLPSAQRVSPADFATALDNLLQIMKATCVDAALSPGELPAEYFANLCMIAIQDLEPELNETSRLAAGALQSDSWADRAPREKAWMSLWRLLTVLWHDRLAPGVQPERLEQALGYALADLCDEDDSALLPLESEPGLAESSAVRFHQLGGRLQQLRWTNDHKRALMAIDLLLIEAAQAIDLPQVSFPWPTGVASLLFNVQRNTLHTDQCLIAPRIYLAGQCLRARLAPDTRPECLAERVAELPAGWARPGVIASLQDPAPPSRQEQEKRLLELRLVWPNRRFRLSRSTPAWMWDALHICGLKAATQTLNLHLPANWPSAAEAALFWELATSRGVRSLGLRADGSSILQLSHARSEDNTIDLYRPEGCYKLSAEMLVKQPVGFIQVCLQAPAEVIGLLLKGQLVPSDGSWPEWATGMEKSAFLFLHTSLGRLLWQQASGHRPVAGPDAVTTSIAETGTPLPAASILAGFETIDWQPDQPIPATNKLDRKLSLLKYLPDSSVDNGPSLPAERRGKGRTRQSLRNTISSVIFRDGVPSFPEHYLMKHYRPSLQSYELPGLLHEAEAFFDRILLSSPEGTTLEVCGAWTAEALILVSQTGRTQVALPVDAELTEQILKSYHQDLHRLWDDLTRECRRQIPRQKAALTLAKRIWHDQNLPLLSSFRRESGTPGLA